MPINKQTNPLDYPGSSADWQRLFALTDTLALAFKNPWPVKNDMIIRGSCFYIGGAWYVANVDVAIAGTPSDFIQFTVDNVNNLVIATYVATLTDVTWNDQWNGWYDTVGNFYVFDENLAYGAGLIDFPRTVAYSRPRNAESAKALSTAMGDNWANSLAADCDTTTSDTISIGVPCTLYPTYNRSVTLEKGFTTVSGWTGIFTINLNALYAKFRIKAMRLLWTNDDHDDDNYVRIMVGDTVIAQWNDETQRNVPFDVTGLSLDSSTRFKVQYYEHGAAQRGPMSLTMSIGCVDDINPPTIMEYIFNIGALTLTGYSS